MGFARSILVVFLLVSAPLAFAQAPETSPRPQLRSIVNEANWSGNKAPAISRRPKLRKVRKGRSVTSTVVEKVVIEQTITEDIITKVATRNVPKATVAVLRKEVVRETVEIQGSAFAVTRSLRPKKRPKRLRVALLDKPRKGKVKKAVRYKKKGSVCGVKGIRGYSVKRVYGKGGCGIAQPVKINEIDGVRLTREALVGCGAAKALYSWVQQKAKPAVGRKGGGLAKIQMIAGYSCRNRNSAKKGRLSEHAKGNAVDIAGFVLKDGTTMSVLKGWRSKAHGPTLKRLHKTACGPFKTVLGPKSNRFHQDHFHFDVAKHRGGGTYCK